MTSAKRKIREKLMVFRGWGWGCIKGAQRNFGGDRIVLYLDFGDGYSTMWVYQNSQNCSSKSVSLYANYTSILNGPPKLQLHISIWGFAGGAVVKNPPDNARDARDVGSIPGSRSSPGEGTGNSLQYSGLGNPMDRGAWWATL